MSETSSRTFTRIVGRVLRGAAYVVLAGIVIFFALTRTEVGRDGIRRQLQSSFNDQFAGSLHIGSLKGTLLNELIATDVRLRDEDGRLVATIDSVSSEPQWQHLFTAELSVQSLTLIGPHLSLHRRADSTWNVQHALAPQQPSSGRPLDLSLSDIEIRNGRITTTRAGAAPSLVENRWLFDYSRSEIDQIRAEASIQWSTLRRRVSISSLRFRLPNQDLSLESGRIDIVENRSRWRLDTFSFELGNTQLAAEGTLQPSPNDPTQSTVDLRLAKSQLDHDQLRRLVPRLPLRDVVTVEGRVGGSLDRFVINELTVAHERSTVTVEGTAFGFPDSLNVDAQVLESRVRPSDLRSVWPTAPLRRMKDFGPIQLTASVQGLVEWREQPHPTFDLESTLFAHGSPGAVRGSLDVQRAQKSPTRYTGQVEVDSLNLAPLTGNARLDSRLTGQANVRGSGTNASSLQGELTASLASARIGRRQFSQVSAQLFAKRSSAEANLSLQQPSGGSLTARGTLNATGSVPRYDLTAALTDFNLAGAHPPLPSSQLNARLTLKGQGQTPERLIGSLGIAIDSSHLRRGDRILPLPPHEATLALNAPSSSDPRVRLKGTIASGTIEGRPLHPVVRTSSRLWANTLRRAVEREMNRASRSGSDTIAVPVEERTPPLHDRAQKIRVQTDADSPLHLRGNLSIHRMDLLRTWWPGAPNRADGLHTTAEMTLGPDTLSTRGTVEASHLQAGSRQVDSLTASFEVSGPHEVDVLSALSARLTAEADTFQFGSRRLIEPTSILHLSQRTGTLEAQAQQLGRTGPFRLTSDVTIQRGLHFRLTDLYAGTDQNAWEMAGTGTASLYSDAMVVDSLDLESPRPNAETKQHITLHGTVSTVPSDTLHAEMTDVLLYPVGELASLPRSLGGQLNGSIAVTGGWTQPQVQSSFSIRRLMFDRRVLGNLRVQSHLTPNSPDLLVDAALAPGPSSLNQLEGPPLVPEGPRTIEENRLQVNGRVRLPGWAENSAGSSESDQLDLTVDVQRADLFFFKYIFDETLTKVRGYTAGQIHVGGRFLNPLFNADLEIQDGRFTLPQFGLSYAASGPVEVDRKGIHLRELSVTDDRGSATVTGSLLFNEYQYFSFDLSAQLDEMSIVNVTDAEDLAFYGDIRASGPVSLTGPLQDATLRSDGARTTPDSELYIPVSEGGVDAGTGFIVFADSTGQIPDLRDLTRRDNIFSDRPAGEPSFIEGLEIDINVLAPEESTVHLVFDPVVGDVVTAVGSGRVQLQRQEGEFFVYGNYTVSGGTYLFTAGEVFVRRFTINQGTISWDGPPTNAQLDLEAEYRTRASPAGLPGYDGSEGRIPVRVQLDIGGRVETPRVDLSLARVRDKRNNLVGSQTLDAILNQPDQTTEYATSVLLTNTFLLTTESFTQGQSTGTDGSSGNLATAGNQLAFNSVSQLVASQLNRYLGAALPNVDLNFGLQGENPNDLDVIYGVALRLLNERLVIRGEGVYTGDDPSDRQAEGPQGEFVVEVRLSRRVSVEAFYRRRGDELTQGQTLTSSTGAGVSYQTEFPTWRQLLGRVFGWLFPGIRPPADAPPPEENQEPDNDPVARTDESSSGSSEPRDNSPDG